MHRPLLRRAGAAALAALIVATALAASAAMPARHSQMPAHRAPTLGVYRVASAVPPPGGGTSTHLVTLLPQGTMFREPTSPQRANGAPPGDFPFETAQSADGLIIVHSYGQYPSFGSDYVSLAQQALSQRIQPRLGYGLRSRVDIYFYNSRADFLAGAQPESPEITGAYSVFNPSTIYMPAYYDSADTFDVLAHELTHITFHQTVDVGHLSSDFELFPLWLEEGMAVSDESTTSPGYGVYRQQLLQSARSGGPYIDIFRQFLWSYPQDPSTDDLAYAEAGSFIGNLATSYGADRFHQFIADARNGDLNTAVMMDFGADLQTLESQWEESLGKPALHHTAGVAPAQTTATRFTPGHEPTIDGRTRPYGVGGGDDAMATVLIEAGAGTGAALFALAIGALWLALRRRSWRARQAVPLPASTPAAESAAPPIPASATLNGSRPPQGTPWLEQGGLALAAPLALGAGMLWLLLEPARLWRHAVLAGAVAALLLAVATGVLAWRAWRGGQVFVAQAVTGVALLAVAALAVTQTAGQAGMAQGLGYERDSAYALALSAYTDAGATNALLAQVHSEWADDAYHNASDYPVATAQYRAALALQSKGKSASNHRATLLNLTSEWGARLKDAHEFKQAIAVYAAQLASPSCDAPCRTAMRERGGAVYLAWAADLIAQKQPDAALAQLRSLQKTFPQSTAATSAQRALAGESQGLAGAWAAEKAGDSAAMNLLLELVAERTNDPLQVAMASEAPQMVSGTLSSIRLYKTPIHLFFLGFRTAVDAKAFIDHASQHGEPDPKVNTVATQTDKNGAFVVWLPPGYVYIPTWESPPQGGHDDYFSWTYNFVTVQPYTPVPAIVLS